MTDQEIIDALELNSLPEETKVQTLENFRQTVSMRAIGVVDDMMSDEQKAQFKEVAENNKDNEDKVWEWVNTNVTNVDEIYSALEKDFVEQIKNKNAN